MKNTQRLLEMLEFMRPADSVYEQAFINRYILPYKPKTDGYGNFLVDIGEKPNIVWSSHTDTVHYNSGLQTLEVNSAQIVRAKPSAFSNCLGADCTTGVWIMLEMLDAGIPGRYIFHRNEEHGGVGSKWLAKNMPEWLKGIDAAIAFDRKGKTDVITHQGGETASNRFALSLAAALGGGYKPSSHGMFTDTKSYAHLVPECTNISVGYEDAHRSTETQDLRHAQWLRDVMVKFDASGLVISRTPKEPITSYQTYHYNGVGGQHSSFYNRDPKTMFDLVQMNPTTTSRILEILGFNFDSLKMTIEDIQSQKLPNGVIDTDQIDSTVSFLKPVTRKEKRKTYRKASRLTQGR